MKPTDVNDPLSLWRRPAALRRHPFAASVLMHTAEQMCCGP